MSHFNQDFVGTHKKGRHIINGFEGTKVHTIYEGTTAWTINDDISHPHWVGITNSLYVLKGCELLISVHHWANNATSNNAYDTTLDGTRCVTHHDRDTLIWCGEQLV